MPVFLCIETSTANCSVTLFKDDTLIGIREQADGFQHAEYLHVFIQEVLQESGISKPDAIVLGKGPGSYTGLRIGAATAKGLAYAWHIPLLACHSLQTIALAVVSKHNPMPGARICCMTDARRMEVYTALYNEKAEPVKAVNAAIIDEHFCAAERAENTFYIAGDGMEKCRTLLQGKNVVCVENILPSARYMQACAAQKWAKNEVEDIARFEPFYLKEFYTPAKKV